MFTVENKHKHSPPKLSRPPPIATNHLLVIKLPRQEAHLDLPYIFQNLKNQSYLRCFRGNLMQGIDYKISGGLRKMVKLFRISVRNLLPFVRLEIKENTGII